MIDPSAEYPNGADDGILTIQVTEALLGSSPVPFFGAAFSN